jgi:hypothetical protein
LSRRRPRFEDDMFQARCLSDMGLRGAERRRLRFLGWVALISATL